MPGAACLRVSHIQFHRAINFSENTCINIYINKCFVVHIEKEILYTMMWLYVLTSHIYKFIEFQLLLRC